MKKFVFAHLYNDRSGSPRVLDSVIDIVSETNESILFLGTGGEGILSEVRIPLVRYWYPRSSNRLFNAVSFFVSQLVLFMSLLTRRDIDKNATVYVNTILPFGAALYGFVTRRKVVYHLHEISISPRPLLWLLKSVASRTASKFIYVSEYHFNSLPICPERSIVLQNCIDPELFAKASISQSLPRRPGKFSLLMLASLRDYKGVPEFIELARRIKVLSNVELHLVGNASEEECEKYLSKFELPSNLEVHSATSEPEQHYLHADLVLNLSRVDQWIETFGLTLVEAMSFAIPVIAPPIGGPIEIVRDGVDGYLIDSRNIDDVTEVVTRLASDTQLAVAMGNAAKQRSQEFSPEKFKQQLKKILEIYE